MLKTIFLVLLLCVSLITLNSCKKQSEFSLAQASAYYPLEVGKYITYQLDSTVYTAFGVRDTVIHYQVQDRVDAEITDNSGRTSYRILRFIRKTSNDQWSPDNTFVATPTGHSIEYVENNLKFIKLVTPVSVGEAWKGNSYLPLDPYPDFDFASVFTDGWDYTYDSVDVPLTLNGITFDSTIKVSQDDENLGNDPADPTTQYAEKTLAFEKYAKGVGLIYKEFLHWEYQGSASNYKGFGVQMTVLDHN